MPGKSTKKEEIVIIGGSIAAIAALRKLLAEGDEFRITLIEKEKDLAYSRMALPYYINGTIPLGSLKFADERSLQTKGVKLKLGVSAQAIDIRERVVLPSDGSRQHFDKLIIATGAKTRRVQIEGLTDKDILTLRGLEDAQKIKEKARNSSSIAIYGGGMVSLQMLHALALPGRKLFLIVSSDRILSRLVEPEVSYFLEQKLKSNGIEIFCKTTIKAAYKTRKKITLFLTNGLRVTCDMLIAGKGIEPRLELARPAGITTDTGILINEECRTNVPGIYAAGDVAQGPVFPDRKNEILALWTVAYTHGQTAALNLIGRETAFSPPIRANLTKIGTANLAIIGETRRYFKSFALSGLPHDQHLLKFYTDSVGRVIGAVIIGRNTDCAGILLNTLRRRPAADLLLPIIKNKGFQGLHPLFSDRSSLPGHRHMCY